MGAIVAAGLLTLDDPTVFQRYFGNVNPVAATAAVVLFGVAALTILDSRGRFAIHRTGEVRSSLGSSALIASLLVIPVVVVDVLGGFPEALNVAAPQSLLFYPLMALIAEMVFHAVPLLVLLGVGASVLLRGSAGPTTRVRVLWCCIVIAAAIEPVAQVVWGSASSPRWANTYVGVHIFVFNLIALSIFKRRDFLSTYAFRVIYYLEWHVLWGFARLHLLF